MLSDLHPGDFIFGRDGKAYAILAESDVVTAPAYRLTFDDGAQVIAHDEHRWLTFDARELSQLTRLDPAWRAARRAKRPSRSQIGAGTRWNHTKEHRQFLSALTSARNRQTAAPKVNPPAGTVRTTAEIVATLRTARGRANHAIPVAAPLELPERDLPLDPYVLGVWLGDGTSRERHVTTADQEIIDAIVRAGFPVRWVATKKNSKASTVCFDGLRSVLKAMGLLNNKHIPDCYLWASKDQRLALLQGLLDTDGGVEGGSASFTSTKKVLADGVAHLARSLGHKATVRERVAKLKGKVVGPKWVVKFAAALPVFRLTRKAERLVLATRRTTRFRYIVSAERVGPVAMKCLRVASPDHLFLAGEHLIPTHNSEALLMASLQFAEVPGYSALLLRRTFSDLKLPGALMDRAHTWLYGKARFSTQEHRWRFPSGATLQFGYCENERDVYRYQSSEYQFIGLDEATQFTEFQIRYLYSRLRRQHRIPVPLRYRLASNPGNVGHEFIKGRYITQPGERVFIPARLEDNPYLDREQYLRSLAELDPLTRAQLLEGDWDAVAGGRIQPGWFRRYHWRGDYLTLDDGRQYTLQECARFGTADVAASTKDGADYTVIGAFASTPRHDLVWLDCARGRWEVPDIVPQMQALYDRWGLAYIAIEGGGTQKGVYQLARRTKMAVKEVYPSGDKLVRATPFIVLAESGRVWLPRASPWLADIQSELVRFTGDPRQDAHDDVVDVAAYAARILTGKDDQKARGFAPYVQRS